MTLQRTGLQIEIDPHLQWLKILKQHIDGTRKEKDMGKNEWLHIRHAADRMPRIAEKAQFVYDEDKKRQKWEIEQRKRAAQKAQDDKLASEKRARDERAAKLKKANPRNPVPVKHGKALEQHQKEVRFRGPPNPKSKEETPQERLDKAARDFHEARQQHSEAKQRYMQSFNSKNLALRDATMKSEMKASEAYSEARAAAARAKAIEEREKKEKEKKAAVEELVPLGSAFMSPAAYKKKEDNDKRQEKEDAKRKEIARAIASEVRKF